MASAALVVVALCAAASPEAGPDTVQRGVARYEDLDNGGAAALLEQAVRDPQLPSRRRATAWLYLGLIAAEREDASGARKAWSEAFGLWGALPIPAGVAPKLLAQIEAQRRAVMAAESPAPLTGAPPGAAASSVPGPAPAPMGSADGASGGGASLWWWVAGAASAVALGTVATLWLLQSDGTACGAEGACLRVYGQLPEGG